MDDIRFTFAHVDVVEDDGPLGRNPNESDTIDLLLDLDVDANISAFYGSYGVTDNLDIGIAIPIVHVDIDGTARATISSFTFAQSGEANHNFVDDPTNPNLVRAVPYGDDAFGVGDIALRFKYRFLNDFDVKEILDSLCQKEPGRCMVPFVENAQVQFLFRQFNSEI